MVAKARDDAVIRNDGEGRAQVRASLAMKVTDMVGDVKSVREGIERRQDCAC